MKRVGVVVLSLLLSMNNIIFCYADYMDYYKNQTQVGEVGEDGEKVLSRESDGVFVKTLFEREEDGEITHPYNAIYIWELEEYDKLTKNNSWVVKGTRTKWDKENKRQVLKEYKDLNNKWVPIEDEIIVKGNMDIEKLLAHYYVIKKKYPERVSEIPEDKLNNRQLKFSDDTQPKYIKESLAAIENERKDFDRKQAERNEKALKGTYVETIKSYQESLKAHKEYLEEAKKSGDAVSIKMQEDNIQDDLNKIEIYSLMQQYIIEEDPNTNQELIKKWNLTKLTGDDRYLYYNKPSPLKIADGFEIYEDKTEFNCYYDDIVVDANGKRNRVYCLHGKDKNVKTNLDPNRYVVENIGLLQYDIYDKNPIYTITHVRDDKNLIFNGWPAPSRLEEDNQVFEFKYNCPFGVPINGRINFFVTFDPRSIRQYTLKKIFDGKLKSEWKDDYILYSLTGGIRTHYSVDSKMKDDDRERYQQGDNTFTICNTTRRKQLLNSVWEKYYDSVSADNIKVKEIKFMLDSYYKNFHGVLDSN